jgi:hypothetical protein
MRRSEYLLVVSFIILRCCHVEIDRAIVVHQGEYSCQIFEFIWHHRCWSQIIDLLLGSRVCVIESSSILESSRIAHIWLSCLVEELDEAKLSKSLAGSRCDIDSVYSFVVGNCHCLWVKFDTEGAGSVISNILTDIWEQ